jgi:hypothetical protein
LDFSALAITWKLVWIHIARFDLTFYTLDRRCVLWF